MALTTSFAFLLLLVSGALAFVQAMSCVGNPWSCANYPMEGDCHYGDYRDIVTGCTWEESFSFGTCTGTPSPCSSFSEEECSHQLGCGVDYWCDFNVNSPEFFCVKEEYPRPGFKTAYRECPSSGDHLSCDRCTIYETDSEYQSISFSNPNKCTSCTLCSSSVAWDCSNLADGPCSIRDCDGNCVGNDSDDSESNGSVVGDSERPDHNDPESNDSAGDSLSDACHSLPVALFAMMILCALC